MASKKKPTKKTKAARKAKTKADTQPESIGENMKDMFKVEPLTPETETTSGPVTDFTPDASVPAELLPHAHDVFNLLADATRLTILKALATGEKCVGEIAPEIPQPTISHHLGLLRMGRIITADRRGKSVFYRLGPVAKLIDGEIDICCDGMNVHICFN